MQLWTATCKSSETRGNTFLEEKGRLGGAVINKKSFGGNWEFEAWCPFLSCIVARQGGGGSSFCWWPWVVFFLWGHTARLFLVGWDLHGCLALCVWELPAVASQPRFLGFPCVFSQWKLYSSCVSLISMKVWRSRPERSWLHHPHGAHALRALHALYMLLPRQALE